MSRRSHKPPRRGWRWSSRPPIDYWREGTDGPGLRHAVPLRPLIRTRAERRSAQFAERGLRKHIEGVLGELRSLGVPEMIVERAERDFVARLALVHAQLAEHARLTAGLAPAVVPLGELGAGIVRLRLASGLSQAQLAARLGVNPSVVSRDERSGYERVSLAKALKVLDALGVVGTVRLATHPPAQARSLGPPDTPRSLDQPPPGEPGPQD